VSEFKWHMMAEEMPEKGKKDYLVMGPNGGLYLAPRFEGYGEDGNDVWFRDTRGNLHYPDKVLAWAEVPKLEDRDAQESENTKLRELCKDMWRYMVRSVQYDGRLYPARFLSRMNELEIDVDA